MHQFLIVSTFDLNEFCAINQNTKWKWSIGARKSLRFHWLRLTKWFVFKCFLVPFDSLSVLEVVHSLRQSNYFLILKLNVRSTAQLAHNLNTSRFDRALNLKCLKFFRRQRGANAWLKRTIQRTFYVVNELRERKESREAKHNASWIYIWYLQQWSLTTMESCERIRLKNVLRSFVAVTIGRVQYRRTCFFAKQEHDKHAWMENFIIGKVENA